VSLSEVQLNPSGPRRRKSPARVQQRGARKIKGFHTAMWPGREFSGTACASAPRKHAILTVVGVLTALREWPFGFLHTPNTPQKNCFACEPGAPFNLLSRYFYKQVSNLSAHRAKHSAKQGLLFSAVNFFSPGLIWPPPAPAQSSCGRLRRPDHIGVRTARFFETFGSTTHAISKIYTASARTASRASC
jgi:hypothetical protein